MRRAPTPLMARLTLSTAIAASYADLARLAAVRDTADTNLRIREDTLRMMQAREAEGLENRAVVPRAESNRADGRRRAGRRRRADRPHPQRHRRAGGPGARPRPGDQPPGGSASAHAFGLPAGLGIDIVGRRPDIVAARLRAEAQGQRIQAARAEFYPNVSLSALIGLQSLGHRQPAPGRLRLRLGRPRDHAADLLRAAASQGTYRGTRADYDAAVAVYDADADHSAARSRRRRRAAARPRCPAAREPRRTGGIGDAPTGLLEARYRGGLATYLEVLSAEDALISNRRAVAELEASAFALDVALVRALGGGFRS